MKDNNIELLVFTWAEIGSLLEYLAGKLENDDFMNAAARLNSISIKIKAIYEAEARPAADLSADDVIKEK